MYRVYDEKAGNHAAAVGSGRKFHAAFSIMGRSRIKVINKKELLIAKIINKNHRY